MCCLLPGRSYSLTSLLFLAVIPWNKSTIEAELLDFVQLEWISFFLFFFFLTPWHKYSVATGPVISSLLCLYVHMEWVIVGMTCDPWCNGAFLLVSHSVCMGKHLQRLFQGRTRWGGGVRILFLRCKKYRLKVWDYPQDLLNMSFPYICWEIEIGAKEIFFLSNSITCHKQTGTLVLSLRFYTQLFFFSWISAHILVECSQESHWRLFLWPDQR